MLSVEFKSQTLTKVSKVRTVQRTERNGGVITSRVWNSAFEF
ncbi:hypothetical protein LEP1GSC081_4287 [Leptospira kirschneri str. H1]|uniref:Uncharacterized protein n=1 Tax=Leptospira kirschneri str. H1 TaxID=1049966 RepID=A0A0E2B905_9LEPT|nr:hypothetical protein LEP1GSC081_4287 [Leptospira kirschneri str. H1]